MRAIIGGQTMVASESDSFQYSYNVYNFSIFEFMPGVLKSLTAT